MKSFFRKLLVSSIMFTLVGMNFIGDIAYATNLVNGINTTNNTINNNTINNSANNTSNGIVEKSENVEPVEFSAIIGDLNQPIIDMNKEQLIKMNIKLNNGAYLTDIIVSLNSLLVINFISFKNSFSIILLLVYA